MMQHAITHMKSCNTSIIWWDAIGYTQSLETLKCSMVKLYISFYCDVAFYFKF